MPLVTSILKALRAIPHIPFMVRRFSRLADATAAQDWNYVAATLEELHAKGLNSDDTHFRLACAYCMLKRWDPAVAEFERIRSELPSSKENARRYFNYALALSKIGRKDESLGTLESAGVPAWPPHLRVKGEQLLKHLKEGSVPPPNVQ
jgi:tetratricopeptide (TPR) repeat protein